MDPHVVEKILIIAGTSGTGLRTLYNCMNKGRILRREGVCLYLFEDLLLEESKGMPCADIEQITAMMLTSKPSAIKIFMKAVEKIKARSKARGCSRLIVFAHLTYLSHRSIIANPVLGDLLRLGKETDIIYMTEDFYDAINDMVMVAKERITPSKEGCASVPETPYSIDPVLYLTWRAADINILNIAENIKPGTRVYLFGVKHPYTAFELLLDRALSTGEEELAGKSPPTAYVSHPITNIREIYVALRSKPMSKIPLAYVIEAFKDAIRHRNEKLILFEPTTIDETHKDWFSRILDKIPITPVDAICKSFCGSPSEGVITPSRDEPVVHSIVVDEYNRWPVSEDNLREYCAERRVYPYLGEGEVNILSPVFSILYGTEMYKHIVYDVAFSNLAEEGPMGRMRGIISSQIADMVLAQIEERDYAYVSQSDFIIAVTTALIVPDGKPGLEPGVYIPYSTGMDAEIQRARALSKPTVYYILPVCLKALEKIADNEEQVKALYNAVRRGFKPCSRFKVSCDKEKVREALRDCAVRVQKGGLFATIGGGVRVCSVPVLVEGGESYDELVRAYSESIC